ncbi:MAG: hypothetical protein U0359_19620 [Byssovorax sp.]
MRRRWLLAGLLGLVSFPGCGAAGDVRPGAILPPPGPGAAPLWDLAPAGAKFGVVLHDGAAASLTSLLPFAEHGPLQELTAQLAGEVFPDLPLNLVSARWDEAGLDPRRGAAFFSPAGPASALFVLPVGDRDRFRRTMHVTVRRVDDRELDEIAQGYLCEARAGRYACARTLAALDRAFAPHDSELGRAMRALPREERGALEAYGDAKAFEMQPVTSELAILGYVRAGMLLVRLGPASVEMEARLPGEMRTFLAESLYASTAWTDPKSGERAAPTSLRLRVDPTLIVARLFPSPSGERRAALLAELTGEVSLSTAGEGPIGLALSLGLRDPAPVAPHLGALCAGVFEALGRAGGDVKIDEKDGCAAIVGPPTNNPPWLASPLPVRIALEGTRLVLRAGKPSDRAAEDARDDATGGSGGPMTAALSARWLSLGPEVAAGDGLQRAMPWLDPYTLAQVDAWNRLGAHLDAASLEARLRPDGLGLRLDLRTFAGDPAEARAAYEAALARRFSGDEAGYEDALAAIAARFPGTGVGRRAARARAGGPWLGVGALLVAGLVWMERR